MESVKINSSVIKPKPPDRRISCGYCFGIFTETEFKEHCCIFMWFRKTMKRLLRIN